MVGRTTVTTIAGLFCAISTLYGVSSQNEGDIRLTGGQNSTEGRVEVFLASQWYSVCDDEWGDEDARVVCRQLNFPWPGAISFVRGGDFLPSSNLTYGIDNVNCNGDERQLIDCLHITTPNCRIGLEDAAVRCLQGDQPIYNDGSGEVRLVDGRSPNNGRVEINVNGNWSTVCDEFWSAPDARVVCRELRFDVTEHSAAIDAPTEEGDGLPTLVEMFFCLGDESRLSDCPHKFIDGPYDCLHATVTCLPVITDVPEGSVRLVGSPMSGRLEILIDNVWGTVCDDGFTRYSAEVICRQLNFTNQTEGRVSTAAAGLGPIWLTDVSCIGNESSLLGCSSSSQTRSCNHNEDVAITCYQYSVCRQGDIRLLNGNSSAEGRVEMCYNDAWSTICHTFWDSRDARQVCRQLNLPSTAALPYRSAFFGEGVGTIVYDRVSCTNPSGRTVFDDCTYRTSSSCSHSRDAGVRCESAESLTADKIRLVGGRTPLEGRVEVLVGGEWGTICDDRDWNASAAATVCRQLGFPTNGSIPLFDSAFGPGADDQPIHFNDLKCAGNEAGPQACTFTMDLSGCSHSEDASVICSPPPAPPAPENFQVRLNNTDCTTVTFSWTSPQLQESLYHYRIKIGSLNNESISELTIPATKRQHTVELECETNYFSYITSFFLQAPGADSNLVLFKTKLIIAFLVMMTVLTKKAVVVNILAWLQNLKCSEGKNKDSAVCTMMMMMTEKEEKTETTIAATTERTEATIAATTEKTTATSDTVGGKSSQLGRELSDGGLAATLLVIILLVVIIAVLLVAVIALCAKNQRKLSLFHSKPGSVLGANNYVLENTCDTQSMESLHSNNSSKQTGNGDGAGLIHS